jgi:hypothetical protein
MSSRGWKISLLVVSALALSACGQKKKHRPTSPYQGIWMEQNSIRQYSHAKMAGGCIAIGAKKAFVVQPTGEVFAYVPDSRRSAVEARDLYLGQINAASIFASTEGQRYASNGYYSGDMEAVGLQPNSRLVLEGGVLISQSQYGVQTFVPVSEDQARRLWAFAIRCQAAGHAGVAGVGVAGVAAVPMLPPGAAQMGPPPGFEDQGYAPQYPGQGQQRPRQESK